MIKYNEVTWYSKLAAVVFFIGILPVLAFYIGAQYQAAVDTDTVDSSVVGQFIKTNIPSTTKTPSGSSGKPVQTPPPTPTAVSVAVIQVGQTMEFSGIKITVDSIVSDSRCPVDVLCVWAGEVIANVQLQQGLDLKTVKITSGKTYKMNDQTVLFQGVSPERTSQNEIDSADYRLTFKVEHM